MTLVTEGIRRKLQHRRQNRLQPLYQPNVVSFVRLLSDNWTLQSSKSILISLRNIFILLDAWKLDKNVFFMSDLYFRDSSQICLPSRQALISLIVKTTSNRSFCYYFSCLIAENDRILIEMYYEFDYDCDFCIFMSVGQSFRGHSPHTGLCMQENNYTRTRVVHVMNLGQQLRMTTQPWSSKMQKEARPHPWLTPTAVDPHSNATPLWPRMYWHVP